MNASTATPSFSPITQSERIEVIDILRGIALFGILMVNMHLFAHPWYAPHLTAESSTLDRVVAWVIGVFFNTKFFSLFSFLFGLGMSVQMSRAEEAGKRFVPLYMRRLLILMVFGLAHAVLLWIGDILFIYSILGFAVLFFWRKAKPRTLLIWVGIIGGIMMLIYALGSGSLWLGWTKTPSKMQEMGSELVTEYAEINARDYEVYGNGSYFEITQERFSDFFGLFAILIFFIPSILIMFLLGLYFGKRRLLHDIDANVPFFRRLLMVLLPIGLITNIAATSLAPEYGAGAEAIKPEVLIGLLLLVIAGPTLSLSYVCMVVLGTRNDRIAKLLTPFAAAGRMALTNYLMQSIVMTTIFYGYGFGLLGTTSAAGEALIVVVFYALQVAFSNWWMARFRFGPFEWLWRTLTYGRSQPMKRTASMAAEPA